MGGIVDDAGKIRLSAPQLAKFGDIEPKRLGIDFDLDLARSNKVHAVAGLAAAHDNGPGGVVPGPQQPCDLGYRRGADGLEEGHLLASISCLDARGRLAMMSLDFYIRLSRRKLITGQIFNLPLTQIQIGNYLGLTVVHINRVLLSLRDDRIINLDRHCVTIIDLARRTSFARNGEPVSSRGRIAEGTGKSFDRDQPAARNSAT